MARGNIEQRSKGSWSIRVELDPDPVTGKRRQKRETFRGSKHDAEDRMNALLASAISGTLGHTPDVTVKDYLERWLRDHAVPNLAPMTSVRYANLLATHVIPHIGRLQLDKLRAQHVRDLLAKLRSAKNGRKEGVTISALTQRHAYRVFKTALNHAVDQGLIPVSPAVRVKAPTASAAEMRTWDAQQTRAFLAAAVGDSERWHAYFTAALTCGLRLSELAGLRWSDLDLVAGTLSVRQTIQDVPGVGRVVKPPKTASSRRRIDLGADVAALLRRYKAWQNARRLAAPAWEMPELVFTTLAGAPIDPNTVRAALKRIAKAAKVPVIRVHDLRHTAATLMLLANVPAKVVSERLGHANISITLQTYSHVLPTMQQSAASALDALLRPPGAAQA